MDHYHQHVGTAAAHNSASDSQPRDPEVVRQVQLINEFYEQTSTEPSAAGRSDAFQLRLALDLVCRIGREPPTSFRAWLFELADRPFGEAQIAAGYGLAFLARNAFDEVRTAYLMPWSGRDMSSRLMAVNVLWAMAEDDLLASAALSVAVNWTRNSGQERAMTAAIALGGPLGLRRPSEAARWLWALTPRGELVSRAAYLALGRLFALEAESEARTSAVLRFLLRKIRPLMKPDVTERERHRALSAVNSVLEATKLDARVPAVVSVIRNRPGDFEPLVELWGAALNSVPHRRRAVIALHLTLAALADDARSAELAAELGLGIRPRLTARTLEVLDLTLPDPRRTEAISAPVITAFFGSRHGLLPGPDQAGGDLAAARATGDHGPAGRVSPPI